MILEEARNGKSICFEYSGSENKVCVNYDYKEALSYLASVNQKTGERQVDSTLLEKLKSQGVLEPKIYKKTLSEVLNDLKTKTNFEGYVIENEYGNLIKFKTDDWFELANSVEHKVLFSNKVTKSLINKVVEIYSEDKMDDLLSFVNQLGKKQKPILEIYDKIQEAEDNIEELVNKYRNVEFTPALGKEISEKAGIYSSEVYKKLRDPNYKTPANRLFQIIKRMFS